MVTLELQNTYKSIKVFPTIEVPNLTVVTGINGSGKSHLLEALSIERIAFSIDGVKCTRAQNINFKSVNPTDNHRGYQDSNVGQLLTNLVGNVHTFIQELTHEGILEDNLDDNFILKMYSQRHPGVNIDLVNSIRVQSGKNFLTIGEADIGAYMDLNRRDLLKYNFDYQFRAYQQKQDANDLVRGRAARDPTVQALTEQEFKAKHGEPPWETMNISLEKAGFDFRIRAPQGQNPRDPQQSIHFTKVSTGDNVGFNELSSGEQILFSFLVSVLVEDQKNSLKDYPQILLLDEVDAVLNPELVKRLLAIIKEVIIKSNGIPVIMATHSVATVALVENESVYVMTPNGLEKTTKAKALNILTQGVPTLALSYEGRKHVIVESPNDAKLYSQLFQKSQKLLSMDASLDFIISGIKDPKHGSHINTGCGVVNKLVNEFATYGNSSIYGLVDWDNGRSKPVSKRVHILAENKRDGIENIMFDPLLVALLIVIRNLPTKRSLLRLAPAFGVMDFLKLTPAELQNLVNYVVDAVMQGQKRQGSVDVRYHDSSIVLKVDVSYLIHDDHKLAELVWNNALGYTGYTDPNATKLMFDMVDEIFEDYPQYFPKDLLDAFQGLLSTPSHN